MRIAYADDGRMCRRYLATSLRLLGHEVVGEGHNGLEAVEICARERPDVMFLDVSMGEYGGIAAAQTILAAGTAKHVILATSQATEHEHAHRLGIPIITKPFHREQLAKVIAALEV